MPVRNSALLEIRNLSVTFATRNGPFKAVDGIDISVDRDDVLAIVGESGSGKSVLRMPSRSRVSTTCTKASTSRTKSA